MKEHDLESIRDYLDGRISPGDLTELNRLLESDAGARQRFRALATLEEGLRDLAAVTDASRINPVELAASADWTSSAPRKNQPRRRSWFRLFSQPLAAAAAGLLIGVFCTSAIWAGSESGRQKILNLLQDSFEFGPPPRVTGIPLKPGIWSGDYSEVVARQQGIKPADGDKMLRFLRADFEGKASPEGSYLGEFYQLVDLRPYRKEFADGGAVVQASASFNALRFPAEEVYGCAASIYALDARTAMSGTARTDQALTADCLAMARDSRMKLDRNPAAWQHLNAELRLPPDTEFLMIRFGVGHSTLSQRRETFDGHYLDNVRLTLARRAALH